MSRISNIGTSAAGGGGGSGVSSISVQGSPTLVGPVTFSQGSNITLTQVGQNISIAASGGGGSPGGSNTNIQYNNSSSFGGDGNLTWDKTNHILGLGAGAGVGPTTNINAIGDGTILSITTPAGTSTNNPGGNMTFVAGNGQTGGNAQGGNLQFTSGTGTGTGSGGILTFTSGNGGGSNAQGGNLQLIAGNGGLTNGLGGDLSLFGGIGHGTGRGGNIGLFPGVPFNTGSEGIVFIQDPNTGNNINLNTSQPTTNQTYTFPNKTGTFALSPFTTGAVLRSDTLIVAASNSKDTFDADYICTGTNDHTTINNALSALPASGGTVKLLEGTYSLGGAIAMPSYARLVGQGRRNTKLIKTGSGYFAVTFNGVAGTNMEKAGMEDLYIEGNAQTGGLVQCQYAQTLFFKNITTDGSNDVVWDIQTCQDSYWFQWTANTNHSATLPVVHIQGTSSGSSNMLWFIQCRIEDFWFGAVKIEQGSGYSGVNNGFFFTECKFETTVAAGDIISLDANTEEVHFNQIFFAASGFKSGFSTAINAINSSAKLIASFRDIFCTTGGNNTVIDNLLKVVSSAGVVIIDGLLFDGIPVTAVVNFNGSSSATYTIGQVASDGGGTIFTGTNPGNYIPTKTAISSNASTSLAVGPNGSTNPVLQIDSSVTNQASGLKIQGDISSGTVNASVISSGSNTSLNIDSKGTGAVRINTSNTNSGKVTIGNSTSLAGLAINGPVTLSSLQPASDSTTAIKVFKADGSTNVVDIDTTNARMGLGTTSPSEILHLAKTTGNFTTMRFDSGTTQGYFFSYDGTPEVSLGSNSNAQLNFKVNNGTKGSFDTSGNFNLMFKTATYNNISTAGWGMPSIYGYGRSTAQTAAVASVATYSVGSSDGSFLVSANANVTTFVAGTFNVTVAYTDETNTSQTLKLSFSSLTGTLGVAIAASGPFEGIPAHIRCKASTTITVATSGTFTSLTYNVESAITQIA